MSDKTKSVPQASSPLKGNLAADSDNVKTPDSKNSEGSKKRQLSMSLSNDSLKDNGNIAADDIANSSQIHDDCVKLRQEEEEYFSRIEEELGKVLNTCEAEKSLGETIKNDLKEIKALIQEAKVKHREADKMDQRLLQCLLSRKERNPLIDGKGTQNAAKKARIEPQNKKEGNSKEDGSRSPNLSTAPRNSERPRKETGKNRAGVSTILVKVDTEKGYAYADVLEKLKKEVNANTTQTKILDTRCTKKGDLMIEIESSSNRELFNAEVNKAIEGMGKIFVSGPRIDATLEIWNLGRSNEEPDVRKALARALAAPGKKSRLYKRKISIQQRQGKKVAIVSSTEREVKKLLSMGELEVGQTRCKLIQADDE